MTSREIGEGDLYPRFVLLFFALGYRDSSVTFRHRFTMFSYELQAFAPPVLQGTGRGLLFYIVVCNLFLEVLPTTPSVWFQNSDGGISLGGILLCPLGNGRKPISV